MTGPGHHDRTSVSTVLDSSAATLSDAAALARALPQSRAAALCGEPGFASEEFPPRADFDAAAPAALGDAALSAAPAAHTATAATAAAPRVAMHPIARRILYAVLYEGLSLLFTIVVLGLLLGHGGGESTLTAVLLSTVATIWNYAWNTLFERAERRFGWAGRGLFVRIAHAVGYEGGVLIFTIPLVAFMLQVSLLEALAIESSLLVFFLVFTFVYSWAFDRALGLPESAR